MTLQFGLWQLEMDGWIDEGEVARTPCSVVSSLMHV